MSKFLGREQILNANDLDYEEVEVPEWAPPGESTAWVRVRPLSARQRSQIEGQMAQIHMAKKGYDKLGEGALKMLVWCVVDENGNQLFGDADVNALAKKSSKPVLRLRDVITRISGMDKESVEEAEEDFTDTPGSLSSID